MSFLGDIFGGLMPTGSPTAQPTGMTGGGIGDILQKALSQNQNMMGLTGMGLLTARTAEDQRNALMQGYLYGSTMDAAKRKEQREEDEKRQKQTSVQKAKATLIARYPEYAGAIEAVNDPEGLTRILSLAQGQSNADRSYGLDKERLDIARNSANRPVEASAPLVERQSDGSYKEVYRPPAAPQKPIVLNDDQRLIDPATMQPIPVPGQDPTRPTGKTLDREASTRKEFTDVTKNFKVVDESFSRIQALTKTPDAGTGVSDIGIVYSYMKMLDPTSVVRETEYATAENAGGVGEKLRGLYNKVIAGERLTPELRRQFVEGAAKLYEGAADEYQSRRGHYEGVARAGGMDPERVLGPFERRKLDPGLRSSTDATTAPSTAQEANPAVQELIKRSQGKPELRKKLIEMGLIPPPTGPKPSATEIFRR